MSNAEDIRVATAIAAAESQVQNDIQTYITNCIPDAGDFEGDIIVRCPLFKAGKAISKYATVRDEEHPDVETNWKEVVVTSNWTIKLDITLRPGSEEEKKVLEKDEATGKMVEKIVKKKKAPKTKILTEWVSPLTSVVSVVPHQSSDASRGAEFCVLTLLGKDIKGEKEEKSSVNYRDDALRYLAPHHAKLAQESAANRPASIQKEMNDAEQQHLNHITKELKFPSLRCRAYVVPEALGGAATRDVWVAKYREAVFNSWRKRLANISPVQQNLTCVRFAEVTRNDEGAGENKGKPHLCAVVAFEDKSCLLLPVLDGKTLVCTAGSLTSAAKQFGLYVPTPYSVDKIDPITPFKILISRGVEATASLEFFTTAHADAFERCTEQNDDGMVQSFSI